LSGLGTERGLASTAFTYFVSDGGLIGVDLDLLWLLQVNFNISIESDFVIFLLDE